MRVWFEAADILYILETKILYMRGIIERGFSTPTLDINRRQMTVQWRHKMATKAPQITSVTIAYSTICSGADQRKYQSSASIPHTKGQQRGECFHLMMSSCLVHMDGLRGVYCGYFGEIVMSCRNSRTPQNAAVI